MNKCILLIIISILIAGCSKVNIDSANETTIPKAIAQTIPTKEPLKNQYPIILTPSAKRIEYAVKSEGIYNIYDGEKYGFMNDSGTEISPNIYDYAHPFSEDLACVRLGEKYGFIDNKGNVIINISYDMASPFSEGLAYFEKGDTYGFIDNKGNEAFVLNCDSVSSFKEGLAYYSDGGKYGYIDKTGKVAIKAIYDDVCYFQNGLAKVRMGLKFGVIDKSGNKIVPAEYDEISYDNGCIIVKAGGKYGCYDKFGNQIFKPVYNSISMLPEGDFAIVYQGDKPEIIDLKGNIKVPAVYDSIAYYENEHDDKMISISLNDKYGLLDKSDFTVIIPPTYDWISSFRNGNAEVEKDDKHGVIDRKGNIVIPLSYDYITIYNNGELGLKQEDKYVLADSKGNIINAKQYDSIEEIGNYYIVQTDNEYEVIDENGFNVIAPFYDSIRTGMDNKVYNSKNSFVVTSYGLKHQDCILNTGQDMDTDLSALLLQNHITPKIKPFNQFQINGSVSIPDSGDDTMKVSIKECMNDCYKEFKLYDLDGSGDSVLYFYAESLVMNTPRILSYSGFYSVKNGSLNELVTGYECGGTAGGNIACFYKDKETSKIQIGDSNYAGGFMGSASGGTIYEYQGGEAKNIISYELIGQSAGNYEESDLINKANLFYDDNGIPHNEDTILQADYVTEYLINGEQVTIDDYEKEADRYEILYKFPIGLK